MNFNFGKPEEQGEIILKIIIILKFLLSNTNIDSKVLKKFKNAFSRQIAHSFYTD